MIPTQLGTVDDNLTNGDAYFVTAANATADKLAYVDTTTNNAIIKVDNTTTVAYNDKRNTVRIASQESYGVGSVWVADMLHVPFGCSVWCVPIPLPIHEQPLTSHPT